MLRSAAVSACCTIRYYWSVHPWSGRERNPWSFNATTRYWVDSSKFWKPIICRFVLWVLILFQWLFDAKISGGVSLLYNTILLVRASVIWCNMVRTSWALPARWDWSPHAHLPSLVMLIFFLPFSWDSSLIAHRLSLSPSLSSSQSSE